MDIEQLTHLSYKKSLWVSIVLSGLAVGVAAILGRGAINIRGALIKEVPTDATVVAAIYDDQVLNPDSKIFIEKIQELREEKGMEGEKSVYSYLVDFSNDEQYMMKLAWYNNEWTIIEADRLHGEVTLIDTEAQATESELSL